MRGVNEVRLLGSVGADPDVRYTSQGAPVANFTLATNESYKDKDGIQQQRTEWHRIVAFKHNATYCAERVKKGSLLYIQGRLKTRAWQDDNGQNHYVTEIRAERVDGLNNLKPAPNLAPENGYTPPAQDNTDAIPF